jgi:hypothetical protein
MGGDDMDKKLKTGTDGVGQIGKLHGTCIQNFFPVTEIVILADPFLNADRSALWRP